jgi:acetyl esterase/lipase
MRDVIPLADRVAFSELNRGKRATVCAARTWGLAAGEATNVRWPLTSRILHEIRVILAKCSPAHRRRLMRGRKLTTMRNQQRRMPVLVALIAVLWAVAASPQQVGSVVRDVKYVEDGGPEQMMDLFWAPGEPKAAVLFIHGGSLQEIGERRSSSVYRDVCQPFVRAGIACASMDYRLAPTNKWPAMPNDVASAISTWRRLISARGGDPGRLFLFGHSSGCQLAAVVATNPAYLRRVQSTPSDLAGVIAMGCTLDREDAALRRLTAEAIRKPFGGDAQETSTYGTPESWLAANPASYLGAHVPPFLVVVARRERFMPAILEQGSRVVRRLLEHGVPADVVIVPGGHMSSISDLAKSNDPTFNAIRSFIEDPVAATSQ